MIDKVKEMIKKTAEESKKLTN